MRGLIYNQTGPPRAVVRRLRRLSTRLCHKRSNKTIFSPEAVEGVSKAWRWTTDDLFISFLGVDGMPRLNEQMESRSNLENWRRREEVGGPVHIFGETMLSRGKLRFIMSYASPSTEFVRLVSKVGKNRTPWQLNRSIGE